MQISFQCSVSSNILASPKQKNLDTSSFKISEALLMTLSHAGLLSTAEKLVEDLKGDKESQPLSVQPPASRQKALWFGTACAGRGKRFQLAGRQTSCH